MTPERTVRLSAVLFAIPILILFAVNVARGHSVVGSLIIGFMVLTPPVQMFFWYNRYASVAVFLMTSAVSVWFTLLALKSLSHVSPLVAVRNVAEIGVAVAIAAVAFNGAKAAGEIRARKRGQAAAFR